MAQCRCSKWPEKYMWHTRKMKLGNRKGKAPNEIKSKTSFSRFIRLFIRSPVCIIRSHVWRIHVLPYTQNTLACVRTCVRKRNTMMMMVPARTLANVFGCVQARTEGMFRRPSHADKSAPCEHAASAYT